MVVEPNSEDAMAEILKKMPGANANGNVDTRTMDEVAKLAGIEFGTLYGWVCRQLIQPAIWGRRGRGVAHRFNLQQCISLAMIGVMQSSLRPLSSKGIARAY